MIGYYSNIKNIFIVDKKTYCRNKAFIPRNLHKRIASFSSAGIYAFQAHIRADQPCSAPRAETVISFAGESASFMKAPPVFSRTSPTAQDGKTQALSLLGSPRCRKKLRRRPAHACRSRLLVSRHSIQSLRSLCPDFLLRSPPTSLLSVGAGRLEEPCRLTQHSRTTAAPTKTRL